MRRAEMARCIDHTLLKPDATEHAILNLCREAKEHRFAAVCVNPVFVGRCARELQGSGVRTCTVVSFPLGASTSAVKAAEARDAVAKGADECDMVISLGAAKEKKYDDVRSDIQAVRSVIPGKILKVIIETAYFDGAEIAALARLVKEEGADFVKTSTGFAARGASVEDIRIVRSAVGTGIGIKASGGIKTAEDALKMVHAGATRIGTSSALTIIAGLSD